MVSRIPLAQVPAVGRGVGQVQVAVELDRRVCVDDDPVVGRQLCTEFTVEAVPDARSLVLRAIEALS
jgi:hypothetical protein